MGRIEKDPLQSLAKQGIFRCQDLSQDEAWKKFAFRSQFASASPTASAISNARPASMINGSTTGSGNAGRIPDGFGGYILEGHVGRRDESRTSPVRSEAPPQTSKNVRPFSFPIKNANGTSNENGNGRNQVEYQSKDEGEWKVVVAGRRGRKPKQALPPPSSTSSNQINSFRSINYNGIRTSNLESFQQAGNPKQNQNHSINLNSSTYPSSHPLHPSNQKQERIMTKPPSSSHQRQISTSTTYSTSSSLSTLSLIPGQFLPPYSLPLNSSPLNSLPSNTPRRVVSSGHHFNLMQKLSRGSNSINKVSNPKPSTPIIDSLSRMVEKCGLSPRNKSTSMFPGIKSQISNRVESESGNVGRLLIGTQVSPFGFGFQKNQNVRKFSAPSNLHFPSSTNSRVSSISSISKPGITSSDVGGRRYTSESVNSTSVSKLSRASTLIHILPIGEENGLGAPSNLEDSPYRICREKNSGESEGGSLVGSFKRQLIGNQGQFQEGNRNLNENVGRSQGNQASFGNGNLNSQRSRSQQLEIHQQRQIAIHQRHQRTTQVYGVQSERPFIPNSRPQPRSYAAVASQSTKRSITCFQNQIQSRQFPPQQPPSSLNPRATPFKSSNPNPSRTQTSKLQNPIPISIPNSLMIGSPTLTTASNASTSFLKGPKNPNLKDRSFPMHGSLSKDSIGSQKSFSAGEKIVVVSQSDYNQRQMARKMKVNQKSSEDGGIFGSGRDQKIQNGLQGVGADTKGLQTGERGFQSSTRFQQASQVQSNSSQQPNSSQPILAHQNLAHDTNFDYRSIPPVERNSAPEQQRVINPQRFQAPPMKAIQQPISNSSQQQSPMSNQSTPRPFAQTRPTSQARPISQVQTPASLHNSRSQVANSSNSFGQGRDEPRKVVQNSPLRGNAIMTSQFTSSPTSMTGSNLSTPLTRSSRPFSGSPASTATSTPTQASNSSGTRRPISTPQISPPSTPSKLSNQPINSGRNISSNPKISTPTSTKKVRGSKAENGSISEGERSEDEAGALWRSLEKKLNTNLDCRPKKVITKTLDRSTSTLASRRQVVNLPKALDLVNPHSSPKFEKSLNSAPLEKTKAVEKNNQVLENPIPLSAGLPKTTSDGIRPTTMKSRIPRPVARIQNGTSRIPIASPLSSRLNSSSSTSSISKTKSTASNHKVKSDEIETFILPFQLKEDRPKSTKKVQNGSGSDSESIDSKMNNPMSPRRGAISISTFKSPPCLSQGIEEDGAESLAKAFADAELELEKVDLNLEKQRKLRMELKELEKESQGFQSNLDDSSGDDFSQESGEEINSDSDSEEDRDSDDELNRVVLRFSKTSSISSENRFQSNRSSSETSLKDFKTTALRSKIPVNSRSSISNSVVKASGSASIVSLLRTQSVLKASETDFNDDKVWRESGDYVKVPIHWSRRSWKERKEIHGERIEE